MSAGQKIAFHTLGCKLNFSETSSLAQEAIDHGYCKVDFSDLADIYVINTCSVTENADKECRYLVRKVKRQAPESQVIITGCYAQLKPDDISQIDGVDLVLGAQEKFELIQYIESKREDSQSVFVQNIKDINDFVPTYSQQDRTRTFLKIQDGCDYFCTFCTIPIARGRSRSQSIEDTLKVIDEAIAKGTHEIVLTGINAGDFGKSSDGKKRTEETLLDLILAIEKRYSGIRFRFSSIEPNLLSQEIIDIVANSQVFLPHFHIPLQSGSDEMLQSMQRKYSAQDYIDKVNYIKYKIPNAAIGADVIVGYPLETDSHFEETVNLIQSLPISYLHVFTYSERAQTRAVKLNGDGVPMNTRRDRNKRLRALSNKLKRAFYEEHVGNIFSVLLESKHDGDYIFGYTENYIRVKLPKEDLKSGSKINAKMIRVNSFLEMEASRI